MSKPLTSVSSFIRAEFLKYCLKYMLYQPRATGAKANTPLAVAMAAAAAAAAVSPATAAAAAPQTATEEVACPGLSLTERKVRHFDNGTLFLIAVSLLLLQAPQGTSPHFFILA